MKTRKEVQLRKKEYQEDKAATKIQAGYRGMKVRKEMQSDLGEIEEFGEEERGEEGDAND